MAPVACLVASACTMVGPDFETPQSELPDSFVDLGETGVTAEPRDHSEWWTVFNDPALNSLVDTSYKQNLTLRAAGLRILEARANLGIAVGSKYPQSQQVGGGAATIKLGDNEPDSQFIDRDFSIANLTFDLAWELDFWGRFRRGIESADAQLDASIADYDDVMVALAAEVARSYVLIRAFEERLLLARSNVVTQQRALRIADVKFQNGAVTELDVQQAKAILGNTEAAVPLLESRLRQSQNALAVLLGLTPQDLSDLLKGAAPIPAAPSEV
ncbi:MAG: TolC family protein, partial [Planctomycetota bacterium]|nr:TolC family protein [Planctomycetota bacterium]